MTLPIASTSSGCHQGGSLLKKATAAPVVELIVPNTGCWWSARWLSHLGGGKLGCWDFPFLSECKYGLYLFVYWVQSKRLHMQIPLCTRLRSRLSPSVWYGLLGWGSCFFCSMGASLVTSRTWDCMEVHLMCFIHCAAWHLRISLVFQ